jgi:type IV secretory pathway VirJ component
VRYSVLLALLCAAVCTSLPAAEREFDYGPPFGRIALYMPEGRPRSMVLFLSGDGGWHLGVVRMARAFTAAGVAVAGLHGRGF